MSADDIRQLVEEYNAVEIEQQERLTSLFRALRDRHGSTRFVQFGNKRKWGTNEFVPMEERFSLPAHVHSMVEIVTDFDAGEG